MTDLPYRYRVWFTGHNADGPFVADMPLHTRAPRTVGTVQDVDAPVIAAQIGVDTVTITRLEPL